MSNLFGAPVIKIVRNMHLVMCDSLKDSPPRWITATEALVLQGFPVHPLQSELGLELTSFNAPRKERRPNIVRQQAGNAMFLPKIFVSNLHGLLSWRRPKLAWAGQAGPSQLRLARPAQTKMA
jgi:hypothetical protein